MCCRQDERLRYVSLRLGNQVANAIMNRLQTLLWATAVAVASPTLAADTAPASLAPPAPTGDRLAAGADGLRLGAESRHGLTITLYPGGYGAIHDRREVALLPGLNEILVEDVPRTLRADSVTLSLGGETRLTRLLVDLEVDPVADLLRAHLDETVRLVARAGSDYVARDARLVAVLADGRPLVQTAGRLEVGGPEAPWRIVFPRAPAGLQTMPRLLLEAEAGEGGSRSLVLDYLADGLGWQADYAGRLDGDVLRLTGYATLRNDTGMDFGTARVRLVAGEVHRAYGGARPMLAMARAEPEAKDMPSRAVAARRLYTIEHPVSLPAGAVPRVPFLADARLTVRREYRVSGHGGASGVSEASPVPVTLTLVAEQGADAPLPAGVLRVYEAGGGTAAVFVGADHIPDRAAGAPLRVTLGAAFDLTATRRQTAFERLAEDRYEVAWKIRLSNRTDTARTVEVIEHLPGDWEIVESNLPHETPAAGAAQWQLKVPANGEAIVTYRARISRG